MASAFNLIWKISGILGGIARQLDDQFVDPAVFNTSVDIALDTTINFSAPATTTIAAFSTTSTPVCIIVIPTVAGTLAWEGENALDNGSFVCLSNLPVIIPCGTTTVDAATGTLRAGTANSKITALIYKSSGAGKVRLFVIA